MDLILTAKLWQLKEQMRSACFNPYFDLITLFKRPRERSGNIFSQE